MFNYIPDFYAKPRPRTRSKRRDQWYDNKRDFRRPPELLPRDEVARAINSEVKAGRGSPHGGVFLDIASRRPAEYIQRRLPSMYHQFKELADVDITTDPMEIGPTCHYIMGGVRVEADTAADDGAGPVRRRRGRPAACTAPTASAATRSRTCWSSAAAPARYAAEYALGLAGEVADRRGRRSSEIDRPRALVLRPRRRREPLHACTTTCRRRCRTSSASSAPSPSSSRPREARRVRRARRAVSGRGPPPVQPRLAPRARPRVDARRRHAARRSRRDRAQGEPRRPHPRRLPATPTRALRDGQHGHRAFEDGEVTVRAEPLPEMPDELKTLFEEAH